MATIRNRMSAMTRFVHYSVETVVLISHVFHRSYASIRFFQSVIPFNYITVAFLVLGFVIASVRIINSVVEAVFRVSLKEIRN